MILGPVAQPGRAPGSYWTSWETGWSGVQLPAGPLPVLLIMLDPLFVGEVYGLR